MIAGSVWFAHTNSSYIVPSAPYLTVISSYHTPHKPFTLVVFFTFFYSSDVPANAVDDGPHKPCVRLSSGNLLEVGHGNLAGSSKVLAAMLDALQLVESVSCQVAFAAMRAGDHRDPLDHEQVAPPAVGPRYAALPSPVLPTVVANYRFPNSHG